MTAIAKGLPKRLQSKANLFARPHLSAILLATTGISVATLLPVSSAFAQEADSFLVEAGPLAEVLNTYAEQSGAQIIYDADLTQDRTSPGIDGQFGVAEGLSRLLAGSGLTFHQTGNNVFTLDLAPQPSSDAIQLGAVRVEGEKQGGDPNNAGELVGYVAQTAGSASKISTPIVETPRSVSVVSAGQIAAQSADNLAEALAYTPGVFTDAFGVDTRNTAIYSRGFTNTGIYVDGAQFEGVAPTIDAYGLERVEMIRGPASSLYGEGSLGGVVNAVSKRPTEYDFAEIQLIAGNFSHYEGRVDGSFALDANRDVKFRLTGLLRDSGTQIDLVDDDRIYIAPALSFQLGAGTQLAILARYQRDSGGNLGLTLPVTGSLVENPNGQISTSLFMGEPDFDRYVASTSALTIDLDHKFSENVAFNLTVNTTETDRFQRFADPRQLGLFADQLNSQIFRNFGWQPDQPTPPVIVVPTANPNFDPTQPPSPPNFPFIPTPVANPLAGLIPLNTLLRFPSEMSDTSNSWAIDSSISAQFGSDDFAHQLLVGADYKKRDATSNILTPDLSAFSAGPLPDIAGLLGALLPLDIYDPQYGGTILPLISNSERNIDSSQIGIYLQDQISVHDTLFVVAGIRHDNFDSETTDLLTNTLLSEIDESATTFQLGASVKVGAGFAPYLSFSESFNPQSGLDFAGAAFDPLSGRQFEGGIKFATDDGAILATIAIFDLRRQNVLTLDPDPTHTGCGFSGVGVCQITLGEVASRGFELELHASPIDGLNIVGAFTSFDIETTKDDNLVNIGLSPIRQPTELASLWTEYSFLAGGLRGFGLGAGVRHVGSSFADGANLIEVPSYTLVDGFIRYQFDDRVLDGLSLTLNVRNLGNNSYLVGCSVNNCTYGLRRKITGALAYRW